MGSICNREKIDIKEFIDNIDSLSIELVTSKKIERLSHSNKRQKKSESKLKNIEDKFERIARNMNHIFEIEDENDEYYESFGEELGRI